MENILRSVINTILSSIIKPIGDESVTVTRENGFVVKDVSVDENKVNQYLEDHLDGRVRIDGCHLKAVKVTFDWFEAAAVVEVDSLSFTVMPHVGRYVKKKVLGCLDMREDEHEIEARYKGRVLYDPNWNNRANIRHTTTVQYCPNCACDLRRFMDRRPFELSSPPRETTVHQKQRTVTSTLEGKRLYGMINQYRDDNVRSTMMSPAGALYDDHYIETSDGIRSNYSPAHSQLYRPPAYPEQKDISRINKKKKS